MDLDFAFDDGRLVCRISDGPVTASVTASNLPEAPRDLLAALESLVHEDTAECFWHEQGGDYRWMFCRHDGRVDVAVMWCAGVITGWQHVFRADGDLTQLLASARAALSPLLR